VVVQTRDRGAGVKFIRVNLADLTMAAGHDGCWMKAKPRSAHAMTIANAGTHRHPKRTTEAHSRATTTSVHSAFYQATTYLSSSSYIPDPRKSVPKAAQPHQNGTPSTPKSQLRTLTYYRPPSSTSSHSSSSSSSQSAHPPTRTTYSLASSIATRRSTMSRPSGGPHGWVKGSVHM
jgi:hypothetical protein